MLPDLLTPICLQQAATNLLIMYYVCARCCCRTITVHTAYTGRRHGACASAR